MKKDYLCLFVLLLAVNSLFATSPMREVFAIRNSSSNDVIVNVEFWYGPGSNLDPQFVWAEGAWPQIIFGIPLSIRYMPIVHRRANNIIRPNEEAQIVEYNAGFRHFDEMVAIPIIDKLNAIFKRLEIIRYDGKVLKTLEDLEVVDLQKRILWRGLVRYTLEIFFDCYEGVRE